jgi:hypothetical protein
LDIAFWKTASLFGSNIQIIGRAILPYATGRHDIAAQTSWNQLLEVLCCCYQAFLVFSKRKSSLMKEMM